MKKKRLCLYCKKKKSGRMYYASAEDDFDEVKRVLICKSCNKWMESGIYCFMIK